MLYLDDIKVEFESQGFKGTHIGISPKKDKSILFLESVRTTQTVRCPYCSGCVYIYENGQVKLKDIPIWKGTTHLWNFFIHRYKCNQCQETFTEEIPFKYPGTRITYRAANWIKGFLQQKMSIKAIQELTGIHWDTIRKVQREIMDTAIWKREKALREEGYKPRILAVDEFAILSERRGSSPEIIRMMPEARTSLISYNDWVEKLLADEYSVYSDWLGKLVGNTLRIAGILARASVIKQDVGDALLKTDEPVMIDKTIMENAIRIGKYYFVHAINAYSSMGVSSDYKSTLMVLNKIKQNRLTAVTRRDIMRLCRWIGSADEAQSVINHLEDYGFVRLSAIDNSDKLRTGRPKNGLYTVNPRI